MNAPQTETGQFFGSLTWEILEKKISDALRDPHKSFPLETPCPAVYDLAHQIFSGIHDSALARPGENLTARELLNADQCLAVMRIMEAVISAYEDWKTTSGRNPVTGSNAVEALVRPSWSRSADLPGLPSP